MEENCITVDKLSKSFGQRKVIDNLSFTVKRGEVFGLLGHNGAGKSTTIDLILGLKQPDFGSAEIFGLDAASHKKRFLKKSAFNFSILSISKTSLWKNYVLNILHFMTRLQIIINF